LEAPSGSATVATDSLVLTSGLTFYCSPCASDIGPGSWVLVRSHLVHVSDSEGTDIQESKRVKVPTGSASRLLTDMEGDLILPKPHCLGRTHT
jgi:hypothetical protein